MNPQYSKESNYSQPGSVLYNYQIKKDEFKKERSSKKNKKFYP